ncbi:hypothetical protein MCOR25_003852 [Pyricularia grisea]|uniref:Uncharacterized protein n=1 Tax=Pyricularia grisea TaxID=148305 RepID=A0A6P8BL82_PYRGI|nr:uncharacterized protein PgNI_00517 [Pyricularia grisea]KAI6372117.1 hypothetical protein MCOR25_003852 [Pyricularia grisea]TLD17367.1 hypothetical protein PgNI_00517 [Pyricularia grisea]
MRQLTFISALAAVASCYKTHLDTASRLHSRAVDSETSTETAASLTIDIVTDTVTQLDPWPTNLESLGSPLDVITVTITPTDAITTITASPTPVVDTNAALISAQNDYIARHQDDGWKIAVIVVCTVGVFIMLTLFIVATRNHHKPGRNGNSSGDEECSRATFSFGGRRSNKNGDDSTSRALTPFQRRRHPGQVAEDHKGWELKNLWSAKSSSDPSSGVILDLPPLAVRRTRGTTVLSDTDTISPLNPKQQHRGIQASTTASTDATVVPSGTQTTIMAASEDEDDSCTFRGASSSPASAAKPAGMSTLAHDNFKDFVFRGATMATADAAEDTKQNNDASILADESLYNEQGFYISPRNPRTQPAPSYQARNPARVSPSSGGVKRPGAAAGEFVFSNDELEQIPEPPAAKRARRSNEEHAQGSTDLPQARSQRNSTQQQQAGNKSSIDVDRASRASAGQSLRSQPSRAPTPCPGCLVPDRMAPQRLSDEHAALVASSSRPATATGLHVAQAEAPRPARHRMTLD